MNPGHEIWQLFKRGNVLMRLIYVNLAVYIAYTLTDLGLWLMGEPDYMAAGWFARYLSMPSDPEQLIRQPWTVLSYMFLHLDFWHILFNMLVLFIFGRLVLAFGQGSKMPGLYLLGGLLGGALYLLAYNTFPVFEDALTGSRLLGASAGVMAIVIGIAFRYPEFQLPLLLIGRVKLRYIALAYIAIDILMIRSDNSGGHIAHLGGALAGIWWGTAKTFSPTAWIDSLLKSITGLFKRQPRMKVNRGGKQKGWEKPETDMEYNKRKAAEQKEINRILEKISQSGYDSLSKKEKELLFKMSDKN